MEKTREACRLNRYALATENNYSHWVGRFAGWLSGRKTKLPETPEARMEEFLTELANDQVAASTQNQAFHAIRFFYGRVMKIELGNVDALRAKRPKFIRHAPPRDLVRRILSAVQDTPHYPYRLIMFMIYGCGLRVGEPLEIRRRDIDLETRRLVIRQAKNSKDRMVQIPEVLMPALKRQIRAARQVWEMSCRMEVPVKLPCQLGRKYRSARFEWDWFWLFPASGPCDDPRSGERVWWHCLPEGVQKALRRATRSVATGGSITPHHLRHAWATHAHDAGASLRDIQEILGHKSLETTMVYVHPGAERVISPLETIGVL
jgi:site-specific recombinase XerD